MRTAVISLIALAGFAGAATAQEAAPPPAQPAAPATPPPAAAPATPAPSAAAPAPAAPPAAAPDPAANPTLPTEGDGAAVLNILQRVCIPAVKGQALDQVAKGAGMKKARDGSYSVGLGGDRAYLITVQPQGSNKNVCQADLRYAVNGEKPIISALTIWSFLHDPELRLQRNDFQVGGDNVKRITLSWEHYNDKESTGLVFVQLKKADGSSMNPRYETATLLYSERKF